MRGGALFYCSECGGALFYCSDIQAKFGARGYPREASWVLGLPSTISTPIGRSGAVPRLAFQSLRFLPGVIQLTIPLSKV